MMAARAVLILAFAVAAPTPEAPAEGGVGVIERFNQALEEVLHDSAALGYQGRLKKLQPVIEGTFDLAFMARTAVGRQWSDISDDERQRWTDAFTRLTIANYAGRFNHYSGQTFELLGSEPAGNDTLIVRTKVVVPQEENVDISYRLRDTGLAWKVIDVYLKGTVSQLALWRSEYSTVLKREGVDGLLRSVDEKVASLAAEGDVGAKAPVN
jgi:phospholipid transport system substrate-binding protein